MQKKDSGSNTVSATLANEAIKAPRMQVISDKGENLGSLSREEALERARSLGLDLVMMAPEGSFGIPVVRIMNLKKKLYEDKKKLAQAKKKQHEAQVKELRLGARIGEHDFQTKMKQGAQFLIEGDRVKVSLILKGREKSLKESLGRELFARVSLALQERIADTGKILAHEKDIESFSAWSRVYYLKKQ